MFPVPYSINVRVFTQPSIKLSLILIYTLLLSKIAVAESSTSKLPPLPHLKISLLGVQFSPHLTLSSQQQALEQLEETRLKWRTLGNQSQEALTLLQLGILYQKIGSKTLALERYNEALSFYKTLEKPSQEALTLSKIGSVYLEDLEQLKVEQRFAFNHNLSVNSQYLNLRLEQTKSYRENVKRLYDQSLKIYQEINHLSGEASILIAMAQSPYLHDRPEQQKLLEKSLAIYQ